jgi:hypothetical protein
MTGMSAQEISALSIAENHANSELYGANSELNAANTTLTNAKVAYLNASTEFAQNTDLNGDGVVSTAEDVTTLETEVRNAEIAVSEA